MRPYSRPPAPNPEVACRRYFRDHDGIGIELLSDRLMFFAGRQLDE